MLCLFTLPPHSLSLVKQRNQTQVMNEVDTGASGSFCGGGGGGVTRKSGEIRETERRGDSSEDGIHFFLRICQGICKALKRKFNSKSNLHTFPL